MGDVRQRVRGSRWHQNRSLARERADTMHTCDGGRWRGLRQDHTAARVSDNMVHKKLDNRIRVLIENQVKNAHRSLFVVVGKKGREQVVVLHQMLSKAQVKARPTVLWCYKKELGFST